MAGLTLVALLGVQPTGGKFHETVLRADIVGWWKLHTFGEVGQLGPVDPELAPVWWFRPNGRYMWSHQSRNNPKILRGGRYTINGDQLKEFGNLGTDRPDGCAF